MSTTKLTFAKAINSALDTALAQDPRVLIMGEDVGKLGGVFRVTDGLQAKHGTQRVLDTPLAESGIVGTAVGLTYRGFRPIVEIQFDGFVYPAFDQIVAQVAKLTMRTDGRHKMPIVIRIPFGGNIGSPEHHSESPEAYFVHTAGLRVVAPGNPQDAHDMLLQAIASDDPVVYFEPKRRYYESAEVDLDALSAASRLDQAVVRRAGDDVTLVAYGPLVKTALEAAELAAEDGTSVEVVDLRSLSPMDYETLTASVRHTGRLVVAHEASRTVGLGAEISAVVTERCFEYLEHAPVRVTGFDIPYPPAHLEEHHVPDRDRILDGIDHALGRFDGIGLSAPAGAAVEGGAL
ncbi:alpha-ketoacid dehydrogenase subunit beta [Galactobacter valiniphilus]|uniref:3-methyl-2-oxobutanoate dehydrogenase (2-methylpropanoyl-transferring) n=1 Tax=Galactobacter valiniphilus TaxID=2676122 RepID=A0A399J7W7_9MICC|nr:alpha-ketoacid dehydrogenase subunit beta [Galactobacter valiniphilus]RII41210.1 alpha-ketoacid dehydrogenase subunit beta [Galactobacter valiniphilus]